VEPVFEASLSGGGRPLLRHACALLEGGRRKKEETKAGRHSRLHWACTALQCRRECAEEEGERTSVLAYAASQRRGGNAAHLARLCDSCKKRRGHADAHGCACVCWRRLALLKACILDARRESGRISATTQSLHYALAARVPRGCVRKHFYLLPLYANSVTLRRAAPQYQLPSLFSGRHGGRNDAASSPAVLSHAGAGRSRAGGNRMEGKW